MTKENIDLLKPQLLRMGLQGAVTSLYERQGTTDRSFLVRETLRFDRESSPHPDRANYILRYEKGHHVFTLREIGVVVRRKDSPFQDGTPRFAVATFPVNGTEPTAWKAYSIACQQFRHREQQLQERSRPLPPADHRKRNGPRY